MAAAVALLEAEVAPHVATEALPEASLEDLRLRTPALRPMGCWCTGCGAPQHAALPVRCLLSPMPWLLSAPGAQVPQPGRCIGGRPADAAVLRLQRRALLLGRVPEGGLARGSQGRVPAPAASARLTGAAARQPPVGKCHRQLPLHADHVLCQASDFLLSPGMSPNAPLGRRAQRLAFWLNLRRP